MPEKTVPASSDEFTRLPDEALIRLSSLKQWGLIPFSASTLWRRCRSNDFPKPIKLSPGVTAWRVGDIRAFLNGIAKASKGGAI